jgi:hypothetical protein
MRALVPFLVVSLVLGPVALGQPVSPPASQPVLLELPKGERLKTPQGERQGYSLEEMKVILHIYVDYRSWGQQMPKLKLQVESYSSLTENQSKQLTLQAEQIKMLQGERTLLTEKWSKENEARHLCENKPAFGSWVAWSIAGVMTVVAAVLTGVLIYKARE